MDEPQDGPVDLTALDPTRDARDFDRAVGRVVEGARFELARRRAERAAGPDRLGGLIASSGRIAWPAAAAITLMSLALLQTGEPAIGATLEEEMARAVGIPEPLAVWVDDDGAPGISEILIGWEEGR